MTICILAQKDESSWRKMATADSVILVPPHRTDERFVSLSPCRPRRTLEPQTAWFQERRQWDED